MPSDPNNLIAEHDWESEIKDSILNSNINKINCDWHKGDEAINEDESPPSCVGCGRIYWTADCPICKKWFINWNLSGFDSVCAAPYITSSGDVFCDFCGPDYDESEEENDMEEWEDNDDDEDRI